MRESVSETVSDTTDRAQESCKAENEEAVGHELRHGMLDRTNPEETPLLTDAAKIVDQKWKLYEEMGGRKDVRVAMLYGAMSRMMDRGLTQATSFAFSSSALQILVEPP